MACNQSHFGSRFLKRGGWGPPPLLPSGMSSQSQQRKPPVWRMIKGRIGAARLLLEECKDDQVSGAPNPLTQFCITKQVQYDFTFERSTYMQSYM